MKCDERKPQCRHCERGRRDCEYDCDLKPSRRDSNEFNGGFHFSPGHIWLDTPSEVSFVHSVDVSNEDDEGTPATAPASQFAPLNNSRSPYETTSDPPHNVVKTPARDDIAQSFTPAPSRDSANIASPNSTVSGISTATVDPFKSLALRRMSGSTLYTMGPTKPISDPMTARLLQHYIDNLAGWLDLNDPKRQFERFVPHLALSCPILLHAVLAFSACHYSRLDESYDALCADHYHDLCVQGLIPALADPSTALDNVLPISTVILRMYEMMSYETDHQRHLRGCSSLFTHNRTNIGYRELKRTAFWTYFREEISVALSTIKPTNIRPSQWKVDINWSGDTDYVKTEKMTLMAAEVIDYCFGEDLNDNSNTWDRLQLEVDSWKSSLPESFQPLYAITESKPFPDIAYLCTWHVVAMQFYHLTKVLLALHNPHHTNGIHFLQFARAVEVEILDHTAQLCGMTKALGNRHPGALVNAVQPLVICGRCLKKPEEQAELVRILRRIEQNTKWTTLQGIQSLQQAWASDNRL